jgi:hypothetical protein
VPVADEHLAAAELHPGARPAHPVLEADHRRRPEGLARRSDELVVVHDDLGLLAEDEAEGAWQPAHVQWLVVLVEHEHDAIHSGRIVAGTRRWGGNPHGGPVAVQVCGRVGRSVSSAPRRREGGAGRYQAMPGSLTWSRRSQTTSAMRKRSTSEMPYIAHQTQTASITKTWRNEKYASKVTPTSDSA